MGYLFLVSNIRDKSGNETEIILLSETFPCFIRIDIE